MRETTNTPRTTVKEVNASVAQMGDTALQHITQQATRPVEVEVEGNVNAERYLQILEGHLTPSARELQLWKRFIY